MREQGRGTFVRSHSADHMLDVFFASSGTTAAMYYRALTMLRLQRRRADRHVAHMLRLLTRAPVVAINTLSLNGKLAIYKLHAPAPGAVPDLSGRSHSATAPSTRSSSSVSASPSYARRNSSPR